MSKRRLAEAAGVPSIPTRFVVGMHPADLAWLDPYLPDVLARALTRRARELGAPEAVKLSVAFENDPRLAPGDPRVWVGFVGDDLLVLADADTRVPAELPAIR